MEGVQLTSAPTSPKKHRTSLGSRRLSGRPASNPSSTSLRSSASLQSAADTATYDLPPTSNPEHHHHASQILSQVRDWLHHEKVRASKRKSKAHTSHARHGGPKDVVKSLVDHVHSESSSYRTSHHRRQSSDLSEEALALDKLEKILSSDLHFDDHNEATSSARKASLSTRKGSLRRAMRKKSTGISSDTEYQDGDIRVPSAEVVLDNSKTMSYSGGATSSQLDLVGSGDRAKKETDCWTSFKNEIIRLAHTLRLKGWRRVPLDHGADIDVERLSGALTNAVYVVSPPKDLSQLLPSVQDSSSLSTTKRPPASVEP